jgi:hypothetical protein
MPQIDQHEGEGTLQERKKIFFGSAEEVRSYAYWKQEVDSEFRKIVEAAMTGKKVSLHTSSHPLLHDFFTATQNLLKNPHDIIDVLKIDDRVKKQLKKLQQVQMENGETINVFDLLKNPDIGFDQKLRWYHVQIEPRLEWLIERAQKLAKETELLPPDSHDVLDPSMDEMSEGKEAPSSGFYEIAPFYGGYYKGHVYEHWDASALQWQKAQKQVESLTGSLDLIESTKRSMVGKFQVGAMQAVDLPSDFAIDPSSILLHDQYDAAVLRGSDGVWYIRAQPKQNTATLSRVSSWISGKLGKPSISTIDLEFSIGKPKNKLPSSVSEPIDLPSQFAQLPEKVSQKIQDAKTSSLDLIVKARILCNFVRNHLEYSNESQYNNIYKQHPARYFISMWEHKKADCDVANTFAAEVVKQAGISVRMVAGHYVKNPTKAGTTLLHDGTGHAWLEVYDPQKQTWIRMDATPKGDPNMDEQEQEDDLDPDQNRDGDYGEQEAEIMSDEELQELLQKLEEEERKRRELDKTPEMRFAEEANCTPEEARLVMEKIRKLRELKDAKGDNVLRQSQKIWGEIIRKNQRERTVYTGPVRMREGTDLTDPVSAWIDIKTGIDNPTGFERPEKRIEIERAFGGFEVYIGADRSTSMNDIDPVSGLRKTDAQRDAVFLFVDSIMSNAIQSKRYEKKLKNPMPVRICVVGFGATTEIILPLTDTWGPKEQIQLYRALDQHAGGTTPDHTALALLSSQIQQSKALEGSVQQKTRSKKWNMNRFVAMFADGGSDDAASVRQQLANMRDQDIDVFGFGVTQSGRAMEAVYAPYGQTIPDASKLAEAGIQQLVKTIKKWYNV